MKDLNSYLNRIANISRVSKNLAEQSSEFADFICIAMSNAGVTELKCGLIYRPDYYRLNSGGEYDKLMWDDGSSVSEFGHEGDLRSNSIAPNDGKYMGGDFSCWVQFPNREEILKLLALKEEILKELAEFGE